MHASGIQIKLEVLSYRGKSLKAEIQIPLAKDKLFVSVSKWAGQLSY